MMRHGSVQYDGTGVSYIFLNKITLSFFFWAINHFGAITVKLMKTLYSDMHSITAFQSIIDHMYNDCIITTIYKIHH